MRPEANLQLLYLQSCRHLKLWWVGIGKVDFEGNEFKIENWEKIKEKQKTRCINKFFESDIMVRPKPAFTKIKIFSVVIWYYRGTNGMVPYINPG